MDRNSNEHNVWIASAQLCSLCSVNQQQCPLEEDSQDLEWVRNVLKADVIFYQICSLDKSADFQSS